MKMSKQRYELLKAAIKAVVEYFGPDFVRDYAKENGESRTLWLLHCRATDQLQYNDTHPFFVNGTWTRVYPHEPSYRMYQDNGVELNDDNIGTALKRIGKELGLT